MSDNDTTFIHATRSWCSDCEKIEHARIVFKDSAYKGKGENSESGVFMERVCDKAGHKSTKIAASQEWYSKRLQAPHNIEPVEKTNPSKDGCPLDCGICSWHTTALHLPVFSITNDCNLDCPKCFTYNRSDKKYYKSLEDTQKILANIKQMQPDIQLINITGGEPTMHPQLFDILQLCHDEGIKRITMNTNGLKIAESEEFAAKLKDADVQLVLSMDTLNAENSIKIYGKDIVAQKRKALEVLERLDIPTTLLLVCIKDLNEQDVADITAEYLPKSFVRSITIQNMTFTGKNGKEFQPREHITIDEVENLLSQKDIFAQDHFSPLGSYHPLCYSVAYYICINERLIPLNQILNSEVMVENSRGKYLLEPDKDFSVNFMSGLNQFWAEETDFEKLMDFKKVVKELFPADSDVIDSERKDKMEKLTKMIYIHPHMDEDNFDIDRVSRCGDLVPDENGQMVPACSYNLLYRQKDPRFWVE